jgi:ABC-type transport system substrate-binding protein
MSRASVLQTFDATRASGVWAEVDRALVERAAAIPLVDRNMVVLVSKRVGNYQFHPEWARCSTSSG